jgi:nitrogen fixation NifU-like protein
VHLRVQDGIIEDLGFEGAGCAISTASASLMTEALKGKTVAQAEALFDEVHRSLTENENENEDVDSHPELLGKLKVLTGVKEYPMRVKCATLAWHTLHSALHDEQDTVTTE